MIGPHPYRYTHPKDQRCRCDDCRVEATRRRKQQRYNELQRKKGVVFQYDMVDAGHVAQLIHEASHDRKLSQREIARLTGVGHPAVKKLLNWHFGMTVTARVASKIIKGLEDDLDRNLLPGSFVPVKRSAQMVRSMCAQGWTQSHQQDIIENNTEWSGNCIRQVTRSGRKHTTKEIEDRILWLSQAIGTRTGPSTILIAKCANMGYFPLKHYSMKGDLIVSTLSKEQRKLYKSVR